MQDLLPVGSVIETHDNKRYMIIGYSPNTVNATNKYDYVVSHISGINKPKKLIKYGVDYFYIKSKDIKNVYFIGFNDSEFDLFAKVLKDFNSNINKKQKKGEKLKSDEIRDTMEETIESIEKSGEKNEK